MKVIIVGAGIGGLTAALCLHKSGHEVQVLEQREVLTPVGAGLQCGANALTVLDYLGLLNNLKPHSVTPERVEFREFDSGLLLSQLSLGTRYCERYGLPYWHIHRADLQQELLKELRARAPQSLHKGARVESVSQSATGVRVTLLGGERVIGDCLVGADGIRSKVRNSLLAGGVARFTGQVAWRILVPTNRLPHDWMPTVVTNFVGPKKHAILYYVKGGSMANLVGVVEQPTAAQIEPNDMWVAQAPWHELRDDFAGWHPTVQAIISAAQHDHCFRWALHDIAPLSAWSTNRVTLLGDAAHASLPFMASGATMAIEDARVLDRCLSSTDSIADAFKRYEQARAQRAHYVQKNSARMGRLYHLSNRAMRRLAFAGFGLAMRKQESVLPSYDANTVPL